MKCPVCGKEVSKIEAVTEVVPVGHVKGSTLLKKWTPGKTMRRALPCGCALMKEEYEAMAGSWTEQT